MQLGTEPQASQASSHFPLEPISGSTLFDLETARRKRLSTGGTLRTGCREVDEHVLVDGFERGAVVGISAEEIDMGLLLALQTIAHNLVFDMSEKPTLRRAAIITTLAAPVILPLLRDVIKSQVQSKLGRGHADTNAQVLRCLECISLSRVFDIEGLWEVLSEFEVESPASTQDEGPRDMVITAVDEPESSPLSSPPASSPASSPVTELPPLRASRIERTEVMDSEDEGSLSPTPPPDASSPGPTVLPAEEPSLPPSAPTPAKEEKEPLRQSRPGVPESILVTHFSTLLNGLFTQRDKSSAHTTLQLLSSHLRYLSHSTGSLVMLLNSTTNTPSNAVANPASTTTPTPGPPGKKTVERNIDPTLRSIFNPPPPAHVGYGSGSVTLTRKNKPAFGLTFSQFLDLHLLCTRLPKTRTDAEAVFAPYTSTGAGAGKVKYAWVVEVLLDEPGFWDGAGKRMDREQRWGAVDVQDGVRVVDAFEKQETQYNTEMFRLAAGFGGKRV